MKIEIVAATVDRKPAVANLLELYLHDFSDYVEVVEMGPDGRFGYKDLDRYWTDPERHPFEVYMEGRLAGFILAAQLKEGEPGTVVWDVAEFFILRGFRRRGIGTGVAHQLWRRFPGRWQVRVMAANDRAYCFWQQAIASFTNDPSPATRFKSGGNDWYRFAFESKPAAHQPDVAIPGTSCG